MPAVRPGIAQSEGIDGRLEGLPYGLAREAQTYGNNKGSREDLP